MCSAQYRFNGKSLQCVFVFVFADGKILFIYYFLISVSFMKCFHTKKKCSLDRLAIFIFFLQHRPDRAQLIACLFERMSYRFAGWKKKHTIQMIENAIADSANYNYNGTVLLWFFVKLDANSFPYRASQKKQHKKTLFFRLSYRIVVCACVPVCRRPN